jgi:hypothetical protein
MGPCGLGETIAMVSSAFLPGANCQAGRSGAKRDLEHLSDNPDFHRDHASRWTMTASLPRASSPSRSGRPVRSPRPDAGLASANRTAAPPSIASAIRLYRRTLARSFTSAGPTSSPWPDVSAFTSEDPPPQPLPRNRSNEPSSGTCRLVLPLDGSGSFWDELEAPRFLLG